MKHFMLGVPLFLLSTAAFCSPQLSVTGDIYSSDGIKDAFQSDAQNFVNTAATYGLPINFNTSADPGVGAKIGLLFPQQKSAEIGFSISYIKGPNITQQFNGGLNGTGELKADMDYQRFLFECAKRIPVSKILSFRLGAGFGVASAHISQKITLSGPVSSVMPNQSKSESWSGVTGEFIPSMLTNVGNGTEFEFGFKFTFLPTKDQSENISKVRWNPVSVFAGMRFPL